MCLIINTKINGVKSLRRDANRVKVCLYVNSNRYCVEMGDGQKLVGRQESKLGRFRLVNVCINGSIKQFMELPHFRTSLE